jgi:hypothetical protein
MRAHFIVILCLLAASSVSAQQSLFQSSDGQSAIYLRQSTAALNLGDSKASFGYVDRINERPNFWGFEAFATANSGVTSLFSSDKPKAPEGGGDFTFGRHYVFVSKPTAGEIAHGEDWWLIDVGYSRSSFYLFRKGSAPPANPDKSDFNRFRAMAAYNLFKNGNVIAGIAAGAEHRNNLSDLTAVNLETVVVSAPVGSQTSIVKSKAGFFGAYKDYIAAPIYTDILFYPGNLGVPAVGNRIGVDLFSRSDVAAANRSSSGGLGIFMFKKDDPLSPIGGVSASFNGTKVQLALTVGFTFAKSN